MGPSRWEAKSCRAPALLCSSWPASPAPTAQTASTTAWTLPSGEFTIFGRTFYTPTITLVPRIVFDTSRRVDSTRVVDSVRATPRVSRGFAAGLTAWPAESYCSGPASAAMQTLNPNSLLGRVQLSQRCGIRLVLVPPRRFLTSNGQPVGVFSVDSAKRLIDQYAAVLPPDTLRKYRATILGLNLADDYGCEDCWGGEKITRPQVAEWAAYARAKLPGVPLGVRITPDWVAAYPPLAPVLDYTWAQYHTRRGDPKAFFDKAAREARELGLRVVMGVNVERCYGAGTSPCTAADLMRFGTLAVSHPESCAFISWRYDHATWQREGMREAWEGLFDAAQSRRAEECRRLR